MNKGYGAVLIQNSAGSGQAKDYCKRILSKHTAYREHQNAYEYLHWQSQCKHQHLCFQSQEKHHPDDTVKFIDFTNDGYTRANRKKRVTIYKIQIEQKNDMKKLPTWFVLGKKSKYTNRTEYFEGTIDPNNGADWNQTPPNNTKPTFDDTKKIVREYLIWEISSVVRKQIMNK